MLQVIDAFIVYALLTAAIQVGAHVCISKTIMYALGFDVKEILGCFPVHMLTHVLLVVPVHALRGHLPLQLLPVGLLLQSRLLRSFR